MLFPKRDKFLEEVLSYVKFTSDRANIKSELEFHMLDKINDYIEQGYDMETAEQLAINDMGDPKEIGVELNKQHNPILGWIWKITNVMVVLFAVLTVYVMSAHLLTPFSNPARDIPKSNIVYKLDINEKVKLDDRVIRFKNIIYEKNGNINIIYESYTPKFWRAAWSLGSIGQVADNLGNTYFAGSGGSSGGFKSKSIVTLKNFSSEADTLIINYDLYNRKYRVEIPLKGDDGNE